MNNQGNKDIPPNILNTDISILKQAATVLNMQYKAVTIGMNLSITNSNL